MGTLVGHILPGLVLALLGLWHTIHTTRAYCLEGSTNFKLRFWYPFNCPGFKLKHLELIFLLIFSVLAIFIILLGIPLLHLTFNLVDFEHATMFLHLAIFAGFTLSAELTRSSEVLTGIAGILAASVFGQELFLLHFHSTDHVGLEGHYHWLLQLIVFVSFMAALAATSFPTSFPAALVLSISVVLQGCWFMNMGLMLWVPEFVPQGCVLQSSDLTNDDIHGAVTCGSHKAYIRARSLANLQFSWILSGILIFTGCVCLKLAGKSTSSGQSTKYEQLHGRTAEAPIAIEGCKQIHV